jgi:hypothetical protein
MVTLAADACGMKKHKETYGETHTREKRRGQAVDKSPYYDKAGRLSDFFGANFCHFVKTILKIIFCHNFLFLLKEITIDCHNCLHTQKGIFYFSEISPNFAEYSVFPFFFFPSL